MPDLLLTPTAIVPMVDRQVCTGRSVLVRGSRIAAVGASAALRAAHPDAREIDLSGQVLMPGLVNAHHHSGILRGTAEHLPVWEWLRVHINPMHRVLTPDEAEAAAWLCYAEGLLAGTTTVADMWRFMDGAARAAEALGNRLITINYVGEHPSFDYFDHLDDNEDMIHRWNGAAGGRIRAWVGLEHPFYATSAAQRRAIDMAKHYDVGFYTHCAESEEELPEWQERYGASPAVAMARLGLLEAPRTLLAHAVWMGDTDIRVMAERGVGISHNPISNMKLASGMAPVSEMLESGLDVGLGTDGEKENNNLDMFEELKTASVLGKLRAMDASAMDSWDVLEMGTIGGARALGLGDEVGSIEPGKQADLIAVDARTPRMTPFVTDGPLENLHHNLVHAVRGSDVRASMVAGRFVVEDGRLVNADLAELIDRANALAPGLFARRAEYLREAGYGDAY